MNNMRITALGNFSANGVKGFAGKMLSPEEIEKIASCIPHLRSKNLLLIEEMAQPGMQAEEEKETKEEPKLDPTGVESVSSELKKPKGKKSK